MNVYAQPPEKKNGLLPRTTSFGKLCKPFAEEVEVIPQSEWSGHIGKISLRQYAKTIFDQDGVGSCGAEASVGAVKIVRAFEGKSFVELNPWFVYHTTSGGRDNGSSLDDNLDFILKNGVAPESVWPREKGWKSRPSIEARSEALDFKGLEWFDIGSIEEFGTALLKGFPVVWGSDGHAKCAVEVLSTTTFLYLNSWDYSWGDSGFGEERFSRVNWGYGAWALRSTVAKALSS